MSYREVYREHGQLSTTGSSTGTYLDGVPVTIAPKYRPPNRVLLSSAVFEPRHVCDVLEDEYDFSLETTVIDKYAAQVEAEAAEQRAKVELIGTAIEDFSRAGATALSPENSTNFDETEETDAGAYPPGNSCEQSVSLARRGDALENRSGSFSSHVDNTNAEQNASKQFVPPFSSAILQPTPIVQARKMTPKEEKKAFRVTDFETVQDPFDDLELEVLDDMAELGKVLQVAQTQHTKSPVADVTHGASPPVANGDSQQPAAASGTELENTNRYSPQPQIGPNQQRRRSPQLQMTSQSVVYNAKVKQPGTELPPNSSAFARQQSPYDLQVETSDAHTDLPGNGVDLSGAVANMSARSERYSLPNISMLGNVPQLGCGTKANPLPPIENSTKPNMPNGPAFNHMNNLDNFARINSFDRDSIPTIATRNNFHQYSRHSIAASDDLIPAVKNPPSMVQSFNVSYNRSGVDFLQNYQNDQLKGSTGPGLRSARSTPDISKLDDNMPTSYPLSHSPPSRPSTQQNWNKYTPLPPSSMRSSLSDTSRTSTPTSSDSPVGLPDPFTRLSHEEQELIISIADMGFPRARVARAVQKLGQDDKQVVDHLCHVSRLTESGYTSDDAETSLHLFDNDAGKAKDYLELQSQFQELGFERDKVREALVMHSNNRDKALDFLTA